MESETARRELDRLMAGEPLEVAPERLEGALIDASLLYYTTNDARLLATYLEPVRTLLMKLEPAGIPHPVQLGAADVLLWAGRAGVGNGAPDLDLGRRTMRSLATGDNVDPVTAARAGTLVANLTQRLVEITRDVSVAAEAEETLRTVTGRSVEVALSDERFADDVGPVVSFLFVGLAALAATQFEIDQNQGTFERARRYAANAEEYRRRFAPNAALEQLAAGTDAADRGRRLLTEYSRTGDPARLGAALDWLIMALAASEPGTPVHAGRLVSVGDAYLARCRVSADRSDLENAIEHYECALSAPGLVGPDIAHAEMQLASALRERGAGDDLRIAAGLLESAIPRLESSDPRLGDALYRRARLRLKQKEDGYLAAAFDDLQESTRVALATNDTDGTISGLASLGEVAQRMALAESEPNPWWRVAAESQREAVEEALAVSGGQIDVSWREGWLRHVGRAGAGAAAAYARLGDTRTAVAVYEQARAVTLGEGTAAADSSLSPIIPLVYVCPATTEGVALVVHQTDATSIPLPDLTRDKLAEQVNRFANAARGPLDGEVPLEAMRDVLAWLWDAAIGPVVDGLKASAAVVVPGGLLGFLPLQAAAERGTHGWRYAIDEMAFTVVPSARVWAHTMRPLRRSTGRALLVAEPLPVSAGRLPAVAWVVAAIARLLPSTTVLRHEDATSDGILTELPGADLLHYAGHAMSSLVRGSWHWRNSRSGYLLAARDEQLTATEVAASGADLLLTTLSACETAVPDTGIPDEAVSLSSSFLQAGARAVLASLWPVDDGSTAHLMARFYDNWVRKAMSISGALREAQLWLRNERVTAPEAFSARLTATTGAPRLPQLEPDHPVWWASFTHVGADLRWPGGR